MPSQNPADFSIVLATRGFSAFVREALDLELVLMADASPAQAQEIRMAMSRLEKDLEDVAHKTATRAHQSIRAEEVATRVRPDTQGRGGPRLGDYIGVSTALTLVPGSVGINHEPTLKDNGVGWWPTNEEGSSARVGGTFIGAFDGTRPDRAIGQRTSPGGPHALLEMGRGVKGRGKGTIRRPIPERKFVRQGAAVVEVQWHKDVQAAKARFMGSVRRTMAKRP